MVNINVCNDNKNNNDNCDDNYDDNLTIIEAINDCGCH